MREIREAKINRKTKETDISIHLNLDGKGKAEITTGIGFFDHMLTALTVHSGIDLTLYCNGDLNVDEHHTIEDVGITLGCAIKKAIDLYPEIVRYGSARIPMDESLSQCDIDIIARPFLVFNTAFKGERVGTFPTQMVEEFMRAFAFNAGITLHLSAYGENDHHIIEALFKSLAHAISIAIKPNPKGKVISTK